LVSPSEAIAFVQSLLSGHVGRDATVTLRGAMWADMALGTERYTVSAKVVCYSRVAPRAGVVRVRLATRPDVHVSHVGDRGVLAGTLRLLDVSGHTRNARIAGRVQAAGFGELPLLSVVGPVPREVLLLAVPSEVIIDSTGRLAGFPWPLGLSGRVAVIPVPRECGKLP
jgi:hypothetical protein